MQSEKVDGKFNQGNRRDSLLALSGPLVVEVVSLRAAANCTPGAMEYHQYGGFSIRLMMVSFWPIRIAGSWGYSVGSWGYSAGSWGYLAGS